MNLHTHITWISFRSKSLKSPLSKRVLQIREASVVSFGGFCATYKYVWKIQKIIVPCGQFVPCWSTYKMFHFNAAVSQLMTTPIYCYPTHCMHIYLHMYVYLKQMHIFVCALVYYVNKSRVTEIKLIASISIHIYICISTYVQKDISTLIFTNAYM